jgi:hypothetical protein
MKIALLAAAALTNARLKLSAKVTSIRLILMCAPTAVLAQMFARLKQFIPNKTRLPGLVSGRKN